MHKLVSDDRTVAKVPDLKDFSSFMSTIDKEYRKFKRFDGSCFYLKYKDEETIDNNIKLYCYYFRDPSFDEGKEYELYTEISPYMLYAVISEFQYDKFFKNSFLSRERIKDIFSKELRSINFGKLYEYGFGYAGNTFYSLNSIHQKWFFYNSKSTSFEHVLSLKSRNYFSELSGDYIEFKRKDGSVFQLKPCSLSGDVYFLKVLKWDAYLYYFRDSSIDNGAEKEVFLSISPDKLFRIIHCENSLDHFVNSFFGRERLRRIFTYMKLDAKDNRNGDFIGNNYGGTIVETDNLKYVSNGSFDSVNTLYEDYKAQFEYSLTWGFKDFYRDDRTNFKLHYVGMIDIPFDGVTKDVYCYSYADDNYLPNNGSLLYMQFSPREIFDLTINEETNNYFLNYFLGKARIDGIFRNGRVSRSIIDSTGNGYAGYFVGRNNEFIINTDWIVSELIFNFNNDNSYVNKGHSIMNKI